MDSSNYSHGAHLIDGGQTRFSLWAPDAEKVAVKLDSGDIYPMQPAEDGWFSINVPCGTGTRYRVRIDDRLDVPDPAARAQRDDIDSPSLVLDHNVYRWKNPQWNGRPWHEAVIYELHVGAMGGYAQLEARLPQLAELGITAIELMPLAEFPRAHNWGYDGVLPFAPEASYGTADELKSLIDTAHGLGLMVFVDVVYNHFGPDGNYLGQYAKEFFREDVHTPWGAGIDFRRQPVRDFFCENALMWIRDYRVDGLRFDAVHAIDDKGFLLELAQRVRRAAGSRHVHLILENEDNSAALLRSEPSQSSFDAQWNDDGHNVLHAMLTGEHEGYYADYTQSPTEKLARCLSEGFIYQGEKSHRGKSRGEPSAHLPPTAFVLFLQNHDQIGNRAFGERLISLTDPDSLKVATALMLLSPMIPLLFMGEEWGSQQPFLYFTDHHDELADAVRKGRRDEFAAFSKFTDAAQRERIPDPNARETFTQSIPDFATRDTPEGQEWLEFYRSLLHIRQQKIVPHLPNSSSAGASQLAARALSASWLLGDQSELRIELNLGDTKVTGSARAPGEHCLFRHGIDEATRSEERLPPRTIVVTLTAHESS